MISKKIKIILPFLVVGIFGFSIYYYSTLTKEVNSPINLTPPPQPPIDDPNSIWVVVNKKRPLSSTFIPNDLKYIDEEKQLRTEAASALQKMLKMAEQDGLSFKIISAYRSYSKQVNVYNGWVKEIGRVEADIYSARPGYSEHQTGLAVDLGNTDGVCDLDPCFADTIAGKWIIAHSYEYGFIIRFPSNKVDITGYQYEPWHIRYVGDYLAKKLQNTHQTMEEYFGLLPAASY